MVMIKQGLTLSIVEVGGNGFEVFQSANRISHIWIFLKVCQSLAKICGRWFAQLVSDAGICQSFFPGGSGVTICSGCDGSENDRLQQGVCSGVSRGG